MGYCRLGDPLSSTKQMYCDVLMPVCCRSCGVAHGRFHCLSNCLSALGPGPLCHRRMRPSQCGPTSDARFLPALCSPGMMGFTSPPKSPPRRSRLLNSNQIGIQHRREVRGVVWMTAVTVMLWSGVAAGVCGCAIAQVVTNGRNGRSSRGSSPDKDLPLVHPEKHRPFHRDDRTGGKQRTQCPELRGDRAGKDANNVLKAN